MSHAKSLLFPGLCGDGDSATCIFSSRYPQEQTALFGKEQSLPLPEHLTGSAVSRALPRSCLAAACGVPGSVGCEKSPIPHSLRLSGQVRAVSGTGDAPASSREGSPSSRQLPHARGVQRTKCSLSGAGAGNSSDGFLGKPLRDCRLCRRRNGNRNSRLSGRCLFV